MNKHYFPGSWVQLPAFRALCYIPPGDYEEGAMLQDPGSLPGVILIPMLAYEQLLVFIREHESGVLKTDRTEDLKIIHKLLEIVQTSVSKGGS